MLKYRLIFGTLMILVFVGLVLLDGWLDGLLEPIQGVLFTLMLALLMIPSQIELGNLIQQTGVHLFKSITIPASVMISTMFFWPSFFGYVEFGDSMVIGFGVVFIVLILFVLMVSFLVLFLVQALRFGTEGTIRNVSVSIFSIIYLGLFSAIILAIRIEFGIPVLLYFVFTIKSSDIGAYTFGRLFGKHKLCPSISPGKTWEGLAGASVVAAGVSFVFSHYCGIMPGLWAVAFGAVFGVLGQLGDLIESMIKRDAASKDSSSSIPGFGGLLDVIDSPLATAPAAFAAFMFLLR